MNLYLFNANDIAAIYGIGSYLKELTQALEIAGSNIHIVHLHSVRSEFEIVKTGSIENWFIPEINYSDTFSGSVPLLENYYHNVVYLLLVHIKDTKDLVFHFNYNQSQFLAKELKSVFDCKTVATVHFMKWSQALLGNHTLLHAMKAKSKDQRKPHEQLLLDTDKYESVLYNEVDCVIALSKDMKNFLCNEYRLEPNKIAVIPNGLEDTIHETVLNKDDLRRKWHISEKEHVILFVGRLHAVKGLLFLIQAFRKILKKISDCRLIVAGNGNYDLYFQEAKEICSKISFTGFLGKNILCELYQIADIGVVPSLYEPFGLVALEMMMYKLPIVATATSGLNEVIDDICGLKIPVIYNRDRTEIDTDLMAEKIIYMLQHFAEAKEMGENARKRYELFYSQGAFRQNMIQLYDSLK